MILLTPVTFAEGEKFFMAVKSILIELTPDELHAAAAVGVHRRIVSMFGRNKAQHYQCPNNTEWSTEIEACAAEMCYAKFKNKYWTGAQWNGRVATADVGDNVQIRHTHHETGCLLLYPEDNDQQYYVLVTGRAPRYKIVGWIQGKEGKLLIDINPNARYPAHWIPQDLLNQFS